VVDDIQELVELERSSVEKVIAELGLRRKLQSAIEIDPNAELRTLAQISEASSFQILDAGNEVLGTVTYSGTDTPVDLAKKIGAVDGVMADMSQTSDGVRFNIMSRSGAMIRIAEDTGGIIKALGIADLIDEAGQILQSIRNDRANVQRYLITDFKGESGKRHPISFLKTDSRFSSELARLAAATKWFMDASSETAK
jgi:hypothetical protein